MKTYGEQSTHVSINLSSVLSPPASPSRSFNPWRKWNGLSRFQKSTVYMILTILLLVTIYYLNISKKTDSVSHHIKKEPYHEWPPKFGENLAKDGAQVAKPKLGLDNEKHNAAVEEQEPEEEVSFDGDGDSNQAKEVKVEDLARNKSENKKKVIILPPKDGSLQFSGPQNERQKAVVDAFKHAWQGYRTYAWGKDHLRPISKTQQTWFDLGLTLIDSLDTMLVMGLTEEYTEARDWVESDLKLTTEKDVNLFETTIRVLGGLLSTYHLSQDKVFLEKATELADRMMGAFDSVSGIPFSDVNLRSRTGHSPKWSPDSSTSEVTTIQLEFRDLSRITGNPKYEDAVSRVSEKVHALEKTMGLVPIFINANTGKFRQSSTITMGARGDSYYEYLLKQWLQTGKSIEYLREDYNLSMSGVMNKMVRRTVPNNLLFLGEILSGGKDFKPKMDELACFLPGTLALGYKNGMPKSHLDLAEELLYTCYLTFARQPTFLAPEITYYNTASGSTKDFYVKPNDSHYLLRPETIESLWYLYYITGNKTYQDWGWKIFQGIESYTKVSGGYTTISNVKNPIDTRPKDMMESFFLGETLKYLYLLFADNHEIDLDEWVFNTEAHLLPLYNH